jgi:hypothetical protein
MVVFDMPHPTGSAGESIVATLSPAKAGGHVIQDMIPASFTPCTIILSLMVIRILFTYLWCISFIDRAGACWKENISLHQRAFLVKALIPSGEFITTLTSLH